MRDPLRYTEADLKDMETAHELMAQDEEAGRIRLTDGSLADGVRAEIERAEAAEAALEEARRRQYAAEARYNHTAALPHSPGGHKHDDAIPRPADAPHFEHHYWQERLEAERNRLRAVALRIQADSDKWDTTCQASERLNELLDAALSNPTATTEDKRTGSSASSNKRTGRTLGPES